MHRSKNSCKYTSTRNIYTRYTMYKKWKPKRHYILLKYLRILIARDIFNRINSSRFAYQYTDA